MNLKCQTGYAITKDVDVAINSANGLLFADSTGAGAIREASRPLSLAEKRAFNKLFAVAPQNIQSFFEHKRKMHGWKYRYENLSCLKLLQNNNFNSYDIGTAVLDRHWTKKT